jgi:hypothetical protein
MLFDIFFRLPIKSLMRFWCVSPTWHNIIDDPCLAYMHRPRCAEEPKVLFLDPPTHKPADAMLREDGFFFKYAPPTDRHYHNSSQRILATKLSKLLNVKLNRSADVGRRDTRRLAWLHIRAERVEALLLCLQSTRWDSLHPWTNEVLCHANAPLV